MGERTPTARDVARAAGVSTAVVSYAFNRPDRVASATRERVLAAAAAIGSRGPDPAARALRLGRHGAVALVGDGPVERLLADPVAALVARGLAHACDRAGVAPLLSRGAEAAADGGRAPARRRGEMGRRRAGRGGGRRGPHGVPRALAEWRRGPPRSPAASRRRAGGGCRAVLAGRGLAPGRGSPTSWPSAPSTRRATWGWQSPATSGSPASTTCPPPRRLAGTILAAASEGSAPASPEPLPTSLAIRATA
jgi:hypothetical protein